MYKVLIGIDYEGKRAEPGDLVDDLPKHSVKWLLDQQIVEEMAKPKLPPKTAKRGDEEVD